MTIRKRAGKYTRKGSDTSLIKLQKCDKCGWRSEKVFVHPDATRCRGCWNRGEGVEVSLLRGIRNGGRSEMHSEIYRSRKRNKKNFSK